MAVIGTFTDPRDGEVYKTCKIGDQIWMAENLRFRTKNGGSYAYDNDESNEKKYGRLYTWKAAKEACPPGWILPSRENWEELIDFVKDYRKQHWKDRRYIKSTLEAEESDDGMCNGMDTFGFSALHTGVQDRDGYYYYKDGEKEIYFLSSTDTSNEVICFYLPNDEDNVSIEYLSKLGKSAFPIRCINEQALLKIERERAERRKREITEELERDEKEQNKGRLTNIFWGIFFTPLSIVAYCYLLPDYFIGIILGLISGIGVITCAMLDNHYSFQSDFAEAIAAGGIFSSACLAFLANIFFTETFVIPFSILSVILTVVPLFCISLSNCRFRKQVRRIKLDDLRRMELRCLGGKNP